MAGAGAIFPHRKSPCHMTLMQSFIVWMRSQAKKSSEALKIDDGRHETLETWARPTAGPPEGRSAVRALGSASRSCDGVTERREPWRGHLGFRPSEVRPGDLQLQQGLGCQWLSDASLITPFKAPYLPYFIGIPRPETAAVQWQEDQTRKASQGLLVAPRSHPIPAWPGSRRPLSAPETARVEASPRGCVDRRIATQATGRV